MSEIFEEGLIHKIQGWAKVGFQLYMKTEFITVVLLLIIVFICITGSPLLPTPYMQICIYVDRV